MKKIILIIILIVSSKFAKAQWVEARVPVNKLFAINGCVFLTKDSIVTWDLGAAYLSSDGGYNFNLWPNSKFGGAHYINKVEDNKWRVSRNGSAEISASNDNGNSWNAMHVIYNKDTMFKNSGIRISHFFDEKHGFVLGDKVDNCYQFFNTSDGGITWEKLNCDSIKIPNYERLFFTFFETVYNYNGEAWFRPKSLGYGNKLIRVSNYGWQVDTIEIIEGKFAQTITFSDANNGIARLRDTNNTVFNYLYKTTDGGKTWNELANNSSVLTPIGVTSFKNQFNNSYYLIYGLDGLNYSADFGINWKVIDKLTHNIIYPLDENNIISLFTENGNDNNLRVFTSKILGVNQVNGNKTVQSLFPNPAKTAINIDENVVSCSIYDLTGKLVLSKTIEKDFVLNIESLKTGVYFIEIKLLEGDLYTTKFIKE